MLIFAIGSHKATAQVLDDYLVIAAENNPEVKAAYLKFEAAMQQAPQVSSLPDPTLTMSAFGRMMETRLGSQEARFSLMQMFPWFGTLEAKENASVLMAEAQFQQYLNSRNLLFLEVKTLYAELYSIRENIKIKEENLEILNSYRELALSGFRSGNSPMVNVVKIDIQREAAITEIIILKDLLEPLVTEFNLMLNREPDLPVPVRDTLILDFEVPVLEPAEINFRDHPRVAGLEKQKRSYDVQQIVAEKEGMPMVGLGVEYSVISKRTDAEPMMNGQDAIMPMLSVSLPIYRKKYRAAIKEAAFMSKSMVEEQQAAVNELYSSYKRSLYELNRAQRLVELYDRQLTSSGQANSLLISAVSTATGNFEEVLQMNQDILDLRTEKISAITEGFVAQARLEYLLSINE